MGAATNWTPVLSCGSGTLTSASVITAQYTRIGQLVTFFVRVNITTNGTCGTYVNVTAPFTAVPGDCTVAGREDAVNGIMLQGLVRGNNIIILKYDNTYPGVNSAALIVNGTCFAPF